MLHVKSLLVPVELNKKILIGAVGYHNLSNHSVGQVLLPNLKEMDWHDGIDIEEMNWGPIAIVQQFQAMSEPYARVVLLTAIEHKSRKIGDITLHRWVGGLPDEGQIQACIGDAVTGVISPENLLIIGEYFKIWPKEVYIVDVEPGREKSGLALTKAVAQKVPDILSLVHRISLNGASKLDKLNFLTGNTLIAN